MTTEEKLQQAEDALHQLMLGRSMVEFRDSNGELVRYTPANRGALSAYVNSLKVELGLVSSGPLKPWG